MQRYFLQFSSEIWRNHVILGKFIIIAKILIIQKNIFVVRGESLTGPIFLKENTTKNILFLLEKITTKIFLSFLEENTTKKNYSFAGIETINDFKTLLMLC